MTFVSGSYLECKTKRNIVAIAALTDMVFMVFDGLSVGRASCVIMELLSSWPVKKS